MSEDRPARAARAPGQPTRPPALLLVRGRLEDVRGWATGGLLPVWVVPDVAWTLVVPAAPARSAAPYDDPVALLGGRRLARRSRPSICLVGDGDRGVVVVHESGRRADLRWLVWTRGVGLTRTDGLPPAPTGLVAELAGVPARGERLRATLVADDVRSGADVVDDVLRALGLPGAGIPLGHVQAGDLPGAVLVEPSARAVERFDRFVAHEAELAAQLDDATHRAGGGRR